MAGTIRYFLYRRKRALREYLQGLRRRLLYRNYATATEKRLLIVKLDSIGDYLLFRNFLQVIRESGKYRDHKITLCGNQWWKELSETYDSEWVDKFIWVDYSRLAEYSYSIEVSRELFKDGYDTAITPTFSRCRFTDELMLQSGARCKIAHDGDTVNIEPRLKRRNDAFYDRLVRIGGRLAFEFERNREFFGQILDQEIALPAPLLKKGASRGNLVLIAPGAKAAFRRWPPENFYHLAQFLFSRNKDLQFAICGSASDRQLAEKIMGTGPEITFTDLTGRTDLPSLSDIMSTAGMLICNDSGPYHLGAACGIPLICISNGNHYGRFCPYPESYKMPNLEVFPAELERSHHDKETLLKLQVQGSEIDIAGISVESVISRIREKDFDKWCSSQS